MPTPLRPTLDRTFYTQRHILSFLFLIVGFGLLLALYQMVGRLQSLQAEATQSASVTVEMPAYTATFPGEWAYFTRKDDLLTMHATEDPTSAIIVMNATTSTADRYRYRALDTNPAFAVRQLTKAYTTLFGEDKTFDVLGIESVPFLPGVPSIRVWFTTDQPYRQGRACIFYVDNTQYLFWGILGDGDPEGHTIERFLNGSSGAVTVTNTQHDVYERPVIHSGTITYAESRAASENAERELILARTHANRVELTNGDDSDLVPALEHYRKAIRLLASIRREDVIIGSDEAERFIQLETLRRKQVQDWFNALEGAQKMGDWVTARQKATELLNRLTLEGEADDRLRVQAILRTLPDPAK